MPTLALLDGNSIAYRAFYALPADLATTSGQVTNAIYGFARMLIKLLADHHPEGLAVAWDVSRRTFRSAEYAEYKANRSATPDAFKSQLPLLKQVLDALAIRQVELAGFEADDVIASLAEQAVAAGWEVLVVTGDRDAFQLIDLHRKVLYTRRGISDTVMADIGYVNERYGIEPRQYVDYAALRGDSSDNLPGVSGVGEKTASRLVADYGTLEGIYQHLDQHTPRLRQNLAAGRDQVFLNRRLSLLVRDLDLGLTPADMQRGAWDRSAAHELFTSLEFHSLWEDLLAVQPEAIARPIEVLEASGRVAISPGAELGRGLPLVVQLVAEAGFEGLTVLEGEGRAALIPFDSLGGWVERLAAEPVVTHDAKPLLHRLAAEKLPAVVVGFDTALAAYLIDPAGRTYRLADLALKYLGWEVTSPDAEPAAGQPAFDFREGDLPAGPDLDSAARRVVAIEGLARYLRAEIEERDQLELLTELELPLIQVLARMEQAGIGVDRVYLEQMGAELRAELATLERRIHEAAGGPFNVNSTDQLRQVLYERLGMTAPKKTGTGKPSTDASVLEKLDHPVVDLLLRYRELEKLRSTYIDGYLPLIGGDGRIHTTFNQLAATTGRLSSEEPNLQNIPVRSELGLSVRRAFIPRQGWTFVVADYSQIELRVLAHLCRDPGLVEAFAAGIDIHTATAAGVFGVTPDLVSSEMRRMAKVINFGLLYGMEAFGLASRLGVSKEEARTHIDAYFTRFPAVKQFMEGVVVAARRQGYTATLFGRRRYLPELKSDNFRLRQMGERMALNAPVQGTAADIIKRAMICLDQALDGMETTLLLQIHDELVLEAPRNELERAGELIVSVMEGVVDLAVPLIADLSTGNTLEEVKRKPDRQSAATEEHSD